MLLNDLLVSDLRSLILPGTDFAKRYGRQLRGFVKLKKFQKSEKNSEVGGWVKPQIGL